MVFAQRGQRQVPALWYVGGLLPPRFTAFLGCIDEVIIPRFRLDAEQRRQTLQGSRLQTQ
jgi:hypothetical protein